MLDNLGFAGSRRKNDQSKRPDCHRRFLKKVGKQVPSYAMEGRTERGSSVFLVSRVGPLMLTGLSVITRVGEAHANRGATRMRMEANPDRRWT